MDGDDLTDRIALGNTIASRFDVELTQDGSTGQIWLDFSDLAPLPGRGSRFVLVMPGGYRIVMQCQTVSIVSERYHDPSIPVWIHEFELVDPLSALNDQALPALRPMVDTTIGAIYTAILSEMDPTLLLTLAAGDDVAAINFHEFSTFGDLRKSEIGSTGYVLRMEENLSVRGAFSDAMPAQSDWAIDQDDPRYTPHRLRITPPNALVSSVLVTPSDEVPLYRVSEVDELDGRVMSSTILEGKPFGLQDSEPFKLGAGEDISNPDVWEQTGSIGMGGSHILLNGSLTNLDARPFVFPFSVAWTGIIPDEGTAYQFGFKDGDGEWLWSVSSGDYALEPFVGDDQHTYEIFTLSKAGGGIEVWGFHLHQNFNVDDEEILGTVVSVDYDTQTLVISTPWLVDNTFVRVIAKDHIPPQDIDGLERGRTRILRRSGASLICEELPTGIEAGDSVTRGVEADSVITITHIKDIVAVGGYGLPAISGTGVHLGAFIVQRTGQIEGYLLKEFNSMPDQVYPRALKLDIDATEFSDGVVTGSGSSAQVTFARKFSTDKHLLASFNYVVGGKRDFRSQCGSGGSHLVVPIDKEQDPAVLQAIADRLCALGSTNNPRVTSDMHSTEVVGIPLPFDPLPLNVDTPYRVEVPSVPFLSTKISYVGSTQGSLEDQDVFLYDMDAGDKTPAERAKEQALRGTILSKYPIRVASLTGVRITNVNWDDTTLTASVSGAGTIIGPKGQALSLGGGIDPALEAGIADPNAAPITLRCTTNNGHVVPDVLIFKLIYPPKPVIQEAVTCHYNAKMNVVTFHWNRPSGARGFDIQRKLDPDGDGIYEYINIPRQTSIDLGLPYEPNSKSIKIRSVGLCDKLSGEYVEITCNLPALPAPTTFDVVKVKPNDIVVFKVSLPPTGRDITGRGKKLRVLVLQTTDPDLVVDSRDDFPEDDDRVSRYDFDPPPLGATGLWRVRIPFEDTEADDIVWVTALWVDGFGDEGAITVPFDATRPPMTPPHIELIDFFQLAPQISGGSVEDDNELVPQMQFTGLFRVHLGRHNSSIQLACDESDPVPDTSVGDFTSEQRLKSEWEDVNDDEAFQGFIDIPMVQKFRWHKRKQRTIRPALIKARGPKVRERIGPGSEEDNTRETLYVRGYVGSTESPPTIEPHVTDAFYDMEPFYFQPGIGGLLNNYDTITGVRIKPKDDRFIFDWDKLDNPNTARYVVLIHTAPYGTRGPGTDAFIDADLDSLPQGAKQITVYNVANTVRNVVIWALDVGLIGKYVFHNQDIIGDGQPGAITITAGLTYYVAVLAQKSNGRWSTAFSPVLNSVSGNPVGGGDSAPPGPIQNLNWRWKEGTGYKVSFDHPLINSTSIQYYWAVIFDDVSGTTYMDPDTGLAYAPGTTEAQARFQIYGNETFKMRRAAMTPQFVTNGVKIKVWGVNIVGDTLTEANVADQVTSARKTPGSDAGGPAIDAGAPDIPTGNVKFKHGSLVAKAFQGANNYETVVDYEFGFFYPSSANGTTVARNFFDPDTGADTGVWSNGTQTASFGSGGNSGFFSNRRLTGKAAKAALPVGAITGGVGLIIRAYNKTQGATGPVQTTNPATNAAFATTAALSTYSFAGTDTDFANDRDAANWINSAAAATAVQAGLKLDITKKTIKPAWAFPSHIQSAPDDTPHPVKYGFKLRAGNDTNNWLDPAAPGTPITVDANAEIFTTSLDTHLGTLRADMAAVFQTNGLKLSVRAYNFVAGVLTAGPFTAYTAAQSVVRDAVAEDADVPSSLATPVLNNQPEVIKAKNMHADVNNNQHMFTEVVFKVVTNAGVLVNYINTATNTATATEATARVNIGPSGHYNLRITAAQLALAFGGPTDRNIRAYYYVTNARGTSLASADSASLPFSSVGTDLLSQDVGTPSSLNTPTIVPKKEGIILIKGMRATANNNSMLYDELVIKVVDNAGSLVGFIDPNSLNGAAVAANEAAAKLQVADAQTHTHKVRQEDLIAVWGGPSNRNLRCYYYSTNLRGTNATPSADSASISFASLGADALSNDSAAPDQPPAPRVEEYFGYVEVTADAPTTNITTIKKWQIAMCSSNSAPSTANPPTGGNLLEYQQSRAGVAQFQEPRISASRFFFARALNNTDWSPWSPSSSLVTTSRPLEDVIGNAVPVLTKPDADTLAPNGFTSHTLVTATGHKVCVHVWITEAVEGSGNLDTNKVEVIMPTDQNAFSLEQVELTIKRSSNGVIRDKQVLKAASSVTFTTGAHSSQFAGSVRVRSLYRGTAASPSDGWSLPSDWFAMPSSSVGTPTYDPATNAPPDFDFQGLSSYPDRYIPL